MLYKNAICQLPLSSLPLKKINFFCNAVCELHSFRDILIRLWEQNTCGFPATKNNARIVQIYILAPTESALRRRQAPAT
jgi:hypothetical protein